VSTTILLAVDAQHYVPEATRLTRELCRQNGGRVVLLHVHEVAYGRLGKMQADCPEGEAERLISEASARVRDRVAPDPWRHN
jgi:hypothetical protein